MLVPYLDYMRLVWLPSIWRGVFHKHRVFVCVSKLYSNVSKFLSSFAILWLKGLDWHLMPCISCFCSVLSVYAFVFVSLICLINPCSLCRIFSIYCVNVEVTKMPFQFTASFKLSTENRSK